MYKYVLNVYSGCLSPEQHSSLFSGDFCEDDIDGCADSPCSALQDCTNLTPEQEALLGRGFTCSECPDGYDEIGGLCVGKYRKSDVHIPIIFFFF